MESLDKRTKEVITRECAQIGVQPRHTNAGLEHALLMLMQGETTKDAIKEGVALAVGQQSFVAHHKTSYV